MKSCFFIGHREASEEIFPELAEAVERHIVDNGVTEFIVGNYGGFDRMAARAVISAKALYPGITLLLLLSYHPAERPVETPPDFDGTFYPPGMESVPRRYAIARANRYMVLSQLGRSTKSMPQAGSRKAKTEDLEPIALFQSSFHWPLTVLFR